MNCHGLSDTDSIISFPPRRHRYNTRLSTRYNTQQNLRTTRTNIPRQNIQFELDGEQDSDSMDCYSEPCISPRRREWSWSSFFFGCVLFTLLLATIYMLYTQYLMKNDFNKLQGELKILKGGNKKEPQTSKCSKELDKKCTESLKLLLRDPVGRPDFALESSGGKVVSFEAVPYLKPTSLFGFFTCEGYHSPSAMIQASTAPGQCWAFKGHSAKVILKLIDYVQIDAISVEHIPPTISPSGSIETAPQDFKLWGMDKENGPKLFLGEFKYTAGGVVQTFNINNKAYYKYVEIEFLSNHGNKDFTCVYRIRIHGTPKKYS